MLNQEQLDNFYEIMLINSNPPNKIEKPFHEILYDA
jgi:hypothetical protein